MAGYNTRAIISLQLGHYSNHIGAHFWNIQASNFVYTKEEADRSPICHDILYREGRTLGGEMTYTPRLVAVDLKGSLGTLPELGDLYSTTTKLASEEEILWKGATKVEKEEPLKKNEFLRSINNDYDDDERDVDDKERGTTCDLTNHVKVWSDYSRSYLHPKSLVILNEYQYKNDLKPFDIFGLGSEVWCEGGVGEEIEERIRFFAEEADNLQGFHLTVDSDDGFGGIGSQLSNLIADDYASKTLLAFPTFPGIYEDYSKQNFCATRFLNNLLTAHSLLNTDIVTPFSCGRDSFPLPSAPRTWSTLNYDKKSFYHTSSILAASFDTLTLPWRLKIPQDIKDIPSVLTKSQRKFASMTLWTSITDLKSTPEFVSLTPGVQNVVNDVIQSQALTLRGRVHFDNKKFETLEEALGEYANEHFPSTLTGVKHVDNAFPIEDPFPRIFKDNENLKSTTMMTAWQSASNGIGKAVRAMADRGSKIKISKLHRFSECGLESDELVEVLEGISDLADQYQESDLM